MASCGAPRRAAVGAVVERELKADLEVNAEVFAGGVEPPIIEDLDPYPQRRADYLHPQPRERS